MRRRQRLPSDKVLRLALPELWQWHDAHGYPDLKRPVRSGLVLAVVRRFSQLVKVSSAGWLGHPPDPNDPSDDVFLRMKLVQKRLEEKGLREVALRLRNDLDRLLRWLNPSPSRELLNRAIQAAIQGEDPGRADIARLVPRLLRASPGVPPTNKRLLWVKALEQKLLSRKAGPELSWMQIAKNCCDYGKSDPKHEHTSACSNRIRQGVRKLERTLKKYGIRPRLTYPTNLKDFDSPYQNPPFATL